MKKFISRILICGMVLCCACGSADPSPDNGKITKAPTNETTPEPTTVPTKVPTVEPVKDDILSDEEIREFFDKNCFYSVDSEFDADTVRTLSPFVGKWMLSDISEYFINEKFSREGIMIYADSVWTWVNAYGIPAMTPGQITKADKNSVTLYDAATDTGFTLTVEDDGVLLADNKDTYTKKSGTELKYPLKGVPTEVLGKWAGDGELGSFIIDRTGMVLFDEDTDRVASAFTINRETIGIEIGIEVTEISIYEATAGILVDSVGNVYHRAE